MGVSGERVGPEGGDVFVDACGAVDHAGLELARRGVEPAYAVADVERIAEVDDAPAAAFGGKVWAWADGGGVHDQRDVGGARDQVHLDVGGG